MTPEFDPFAAVPMRGAAFRAQPDFLSERDQVALETLAAAAAIVHRITADPALAAALEARGYAPTELQAGLTLQTAAEEVFQTCQRAQVDWDEAKAARDAAWIAAREEQIEFRWAVRLAHADLAAFRVSGTLPTGREEFIAHATASYRAALTNGKPDAFAPHQFAAARLATALAALRRLSELERAANSAELKAKHDLDERDLVVIMLNLWVRELLRHVKLTCGGAQVRPSVDNVRRMRRFPPGHGARGGQWGRRFPRQR